jgi:hypothetical protein
VAFGLFWFERIGWVDCLAVVGGSSDTLSGREFPANREINREFCEFGPRNSEEDRFITPNLEGF